MSGFRAVVATAVIVVTVGRSLDAQGATSATPPSFKAEFLVKRGHGRNPVTVDRECHDFEGRSAEHRLQAIERRHLTPTRGAPGRPEIEQNDLPSEV